MIGALRQKFTAKAARTSLLRPTSRYYVDMEVPEGSLISEASGRKGLPVEFPKCTRENGQWISPWPQKEKGLSSIVKWGMTPKDPVTFPCMNGASSHTAIKPVPVDRSQLIVTEKPHVTWIGHATCYFQMDGLFFLTDPVFSETCSPVEVIGIQLIQNGSVSALLTYGLLPSDSSSFFH